MIKEVNGDILLSSAQAIAHGVAPYDHFDTGLAFSLRQDFPAMVRDFRHWCHETNPKPGNVWIWAGANGARIINLLTQEPSPMQNHSGHPGRATLQHVGHALRELKRVLKAEGIKSVALPRLSTGVGGLKWEPVKDLIAKELDDPDLQIYVYSTYTKGLPAVE